MKILYHKNFLKDLSKIPTTERKKIEQLAFTEIEKYTSIHTAGKIEKIQGYKNYYKIRFGHFRIGLHYENNVLTFERVLHRKEIYRYFP